MAKAAHDTAAARGVLGRAANSDDVKLDHSLRPKSFDDYVGQAGVALSWLVAGLVAESGGRSWLHVGAHRRGG